MAFMAHAMEELEAANYLPWSFFTYTKNGCDESQYISSIWRGMDFYGFGVSAFGSMGNHLIQNTSDMDKYPATIAAGDSPLSRGYRFTTWDQMVREVLMGVKLLSFDLKGFKERHGLKLQVLCGSQMAALEAEGFIKVTDREMTLTNKGILYGDYVGQLLSDTIKNFAKG